MLLYGDLYIDYGPEPEENTSVGTYSRIGVVHHPYLQGSVEVRFMIKVWQTGRVAGDPTALPNNGDVTAPTRPSQLEVSNHGLGCTQLRLDWRAAEDNVGVVAYLVYRSTSGVIVQEDFEETVTTTSYTDDNLLPATTYYYHVTAVDEAGLESEPSDQASGETVANCAGNPIDGPPDPVCTGKDKVKALCDDDPFTEE